jgi:hypothetical protein
MIRQLPLLRWATRFREGRVGLEGRLVEAVELPTEPPLQLGPGPVRVEVAFVGGPEPALTGVTVDGAPITVDGVARGLDALLDHVHDAALSVQAHPDGELLVKVGHGVQAVLPACGVVTLEGRSVGPPGALRLDAPLRARVGGAGVQIGHDRLVWLSALAKVRIRAATLHPDGEVDLAGAGRGPLGPAVGSGLRRVSRKVSDLVRRSPRFERVRTFLRA